MKLGSLKRLLNLLGGNAPDRRASPPSRFQKFNSVHPTGADESAKPWLDLTTLMAIQSLELRVRWLVEGMQRGVHQSVRRGYSNEFSEYRPYVPGDDLRHMDWRRMARTERPFVRQYEDESEWNALMVMDLSASMAFGSLSYSKADYARTLAGTFGAFLHGQKDGVGLLRYASDCCDAVPVRRSRRQLSRWWSLLAAAPSGDKTNLGLALREAQRLMRRPGLVVVVSDFLTDPENWRSELALLRAQRHQVALFEVLDPQEVEFAYDGETHFEMLEGGKLIDVDATSARAGFLDRMRIHRERVRFLSAAEGAVLFEARTDYPLEPLLRSALESLSKRRVGGFWASVS